MNTTIRYYHRPVS